jgi:high-affinity nickel-transport protein
MSEAVRDGAFAGVGVAQVPGAARLVPLYGVVLALHVAGFGLFVRYGGELRLGGSGGSSAVYAGAGLTAYLLGVRHAFDADHVAAIDDTTRYLMQKGRRPLGVGRAVSRGHSTVVLALSLGIAFAAQAAARVQESFSAASAVIGPVVSASFLYLLAALNGAVLVGLVRTWRAARRGQYDDVDLADLLARRGLLNRLFRGRYDRLIDHTWQVYAVGLLFGLGFDTATQIGAIGLAAGSAAGGSLPPLAILALPLLFAAGMTLWDTTDGVLMTRAYGWASGHPLRRIFYNITLTGLSVALAAGIATIEVAQLVSEHAGWAGRRGWSALGSLDLNQVGIASFVVFLLTWVGAVALWRRRRYEEEDRRRTRTRVASKPRNR